MRGLNTTVQSFWHQGALSPWEETCLSSFAAHGYAVDLYTYDSRLTAPLGISIRDAREIVPEDEIFFYKDSFVKGKVSAFTNLFRYVLLHERGGWWIDTDVLCLGPLPQSDGFLAGYEEEGKVNGAVLFSPPGGRVVAEALRACRALGKDVKWGDGGPSLLSRLLRSNGEEATLLPVSAFYPIHWSEAVPMLLLPERSAQARERCRDSSALHLYNELLARAGIRKALMPPRGSFLYEAFVRYRSDAADSPTIDADEVKGWLAREMTSQ